MQIQWKDMKNLISESSISSNNTPRTLSIDIDKFLPNRTSIEETQCITVRWASLLKVANLLKPYWRLKSTKFPPQKNSRTFSSNFKSSKIKKILLSTQENTKTFWANSNISFPSTITKELSRSLNIRQNCFWRKFLTVKMLTTTRHSIFLPISETSRAPGFLPIMALTHQVLPPLRHHLKLEKTNSLEMSSKTWMTLQLVQMLRTSFT